MNTERKILFKEVFIRFREVKKISVKEPITMKLIITNFKQIRHQILCTNYMKYFKKKLTFC